MRRRVVVLRLMVVPGDDPGAGCMHRLQVLIRLMQRVTTAVTLYGCNPTACRGADIEGLGGRILIYVVAEEHD